jgi:hypothetical protein
MGRVKRSGSVPSLLAVIWYLVLAEPGKLSDDMLLSYWRRRTFSRRAMRFWSTVGLSKPGLFGCPAFHFSNSLFHFLARFERDDKLLWHKHFIARPWIPRFACRAPLNLENAKVSQFDAMILDECFDNRVERLLDDFLGLELSEPNFLRNGLHDLFLGHNSSPLFANENGRSGTGQEPLDMPQV